MKKYRWSLQKSLEFLRAKKPNIEIRPSFFNQLVNLENKFVKQGIGAKSYNWNELSDPNNPDSDELLLTNTFLNSRKIPIPENSISPKKGKGNSQSITLKEKKNRVDWADYKAVGTESKAKLVTFIGKNDPISIRKDNTFTSPSKVNKKSYYRSILKVILWD